MCSFGWMALLCLSPVNHLCYGLLWVLYIRSCVHALLVPIHSLIALSYHHSKSYSCNCNLLALPSSTCQVRQHHSGEQHAMLLHIRTGPLIGCLTETETVVASVSWRGRRGQSQVDQKVPQVFRSSQHHQGWVDDGLFQAFFRQVGWAGVRWQYLLSWWVWGGMWLPEAHGVVVAAVGRVVGLVSGVRELPSRFGGWLNLFRSQWSLCSLDLLIQSPLLLSRFS